MKPTVNLLISTLRGNRESARLAGSTSYEVDLHFSPVESFLSLFSLLFSLFLFIQKLSPQSKTTAERA